MKRRLLLGGLITLIVVAVCYNDFVKQQRRVLLSAYTDNFFGIWSLTLYRDGGFNLTLPAASGEGRFSLIGDTVLLHYDEPDTILPAAYWINRKAKQIDQLQRANGKWTLAPRNHWPTIWTDSVPLGGRS